MKTRSQLEALIPHARQGELHPVEMTLQLVLQLDRLNANLERIVIPAGGGSWALRVWGKIWNA